MSEWLNYCRILAMIQRFNFLKPHHLLRRKARQKKDYLLALDIGTEFVKALIFKIEDKSFDDKDGSGKQGVVVGVGRQRQLPGNMLAGVVADIDGVVSSCQNAIEQASSLARVKPKRAVIGVAGEFIKGSTTDFLHKREEPTKEINSAELQNIIQKVQKKSFDKMRGQLAWETGRSEVEIKPINALISEVQVDGYRVTNPLGFQGKEFFLSIFNVYAPLIHLRALENIASKLDLELLSIAAESYALTKSSGFNPAVGAIFVDIGGGTTDVTLVRQGRVEGIKSLSLAGRTFTKRLSQTLGLSLSEAERVKLKHAHQRLSQSVQWKIREILKKDIRVWLTGMELVLEEFDQMRGAGGRQAKFFPSPILLCGGGSLLPGIKNILKREDIKRRWVDKFPFSQPPQIGFIQSNQIDNIVDKTNILKGPENITPLALASLSLEIAVDEEKALPPILRRVVRIMR